MLGLFSRARSVTRRFGIELSAYDPTTDPLQRLTRLLAHLRVDLVIDVGANVGQYGRELRANGYAGPILSAEPLSEAFAQLASAASSDRAWTVVRTAIGDHEGDTLINVSGNSVSSSILAMLPVHTSHCEEAAYVGAERVPMTTIDAFLQRHGPGSRRPFLKIDTQGYERAVLDGGAGLLASVLGVQLEMSLIPLYDGEATFLEHYHRLAALGLSPFALDPAFTAPRTGQLLQVDGIFVRG